MNKVNYTKSQLLKIKSEYNEVLEVIQNKLEILKKLDKNNDVLPSDYDLLSYGFFNDIIQIELLCYGNKQYTHFLDIPFDYFKNDKLFKKWCKETIKIEKKAMDEIRARELLAGIIRPSVEKMINKASEIIENQYIND